VSDDDHDDHGSDAAAGAARGAPAAHGEPLMVKGSGVHSSQLELVAATHSLTHSVTHSLTIMGRRQQQLALGILLAAASSAPPAGVAFASAFVCPPPAPAARARAGSAVRHTARLAAAMADEDDEDENIPMSGPISAPDERSPRRGNGGGTGSRGGGRGGRGGRGRSSGRGSAESVRRIISMTGGGTELEQPAAEARPPRHGRGGRGPSRSGDGGSGRGRQQYNSDASRDWESSKVLAQNRGGRGRGRAGRHMGGKFWWLNEIKDQGMDTLGEMNVWWRENMNSQATIEEIPSWDDERLSKELSRRGLEVHGDRSEQTARLTQALRKYSLGDEGMRDAPVDDDQADAMKLPSCFPDVYEKMNEHNI
jgi:hypothetical protein